MPRLLPVRRRLFGATVVLLALTTESLTHWPPVLDARIEQSSLAPRLLARASLLPDDAWV